jgi:hypothetical protein
MDFVKKLSVYKIVWIDLNFFDEKKIEDYINVQMITKFLALKIVEKMLMIKHDGGYVANDDIIGDRVEVLTYFSNNQKEFVFDRFLPLDWEFLIDPLAMLFTYLPRSMEIFLHEIVAKYDGTEERFNYEKPVKFDLFNGDIDSLFKKHVIVRGQKYFEENRVKFLEKLDDKFVSVVENEEGKLYLVIVSQVKKDYVLLSCDCKCDYYCKHIYATLKAIRENRYNNFYKVKYTGREETLLEKVTVSNFHYCCGTTGDKILLISSDGNIGTVDIVQNGKVVFEVIEDDDDCSLSKKISEHKMK